MRQALAEDLGVPLFRTSAKTNEGVSALLLALVKLALDGYVRSGDCVCVTVHDAVCPCTSLRVCCRLPVRALLVTATHCIVSSVMGATGCVTVCGAYPTLYQEHAVEPNAQRMVCCGSPGSAREALP